MFSLSVYLINIFPYGTAGQTDLSLLVHIYDKHLEIIILWSRCASMSYWPWKVILARGLLSEFLALSRDRAF